MRGESGRGRVGIVVGGYAVIMVGDREVLAETKDQRKKRFKQEERHSVRKS